MIPNQQQNYELARNCLIRLLHGHSNPIATVKSLVGRVYCMWHNIIINLSQILCEHRTKLSSAKIPQTTHHFTEYLTTNKISNSFLKPIKTEELEQVTHSLKNSNSKGYDNLSVNIIKQCISQLSKPLCYRVFNKSIEVGIVPNQLKIAKIIPVYKSEDKKLVVQIIGLSQYYPSSQKFLKD